VVPESTTVVQPSPTPPAEVMDGMLEPLNCSNGRCSTANTDEYLKTVVMPKILHAGIVHECFLSKKRATKKELAHEHGSFHFEAKLVADEDQVIVKHIYLSRFTNIPLWAKKCLISEYLKMTFPPFSDPNMQSTSAFATVEMSWKKP
jgi:hypothetical protein